MPELTETGMSPRLRAVLARLCDRLGPMYKTQAVKLPYLVDVIAENTLGHAVAGGTYQAWEHGVVTREVYRFVEHEAGTDKLFRVKPHAYSEGGKKISVARKPSLEELTADEIAIVDAVAELYGNITPEDLGYLTKQMNTEIPVEQWGSNRKASTDGQAFLRLSPEWHRLCARISTEDLDDRSRWGAAINDDPMAHFLLALNA